MKKLMVAVAAAVMAAGALAADVNWNIAYAMGPDGYDLESGFTAYFFVDSATLGADSGVAEKFLSRATMLAALEGGSFDSSKHLDFGQFDGGEVTLSSVSGFNTGVKVNEVLTPNVVSAYAVIVGEIDNAQYAFITDMGGTSINDIGGSSAIQFGDISAKTGDINNWYKLGGDVPEPTSAMLLLLGVAGLALKRRHA